MKGWKKVASFLSDTAVAVDGAHRQAATSALDFASNLSEKFSVDPRAEIEASQDPPAQFAPDADVMRALYSGALVPPAQYTPTGWDHDHGFLEGWADANGNGKRDTGEKRTGEIDPTLQTDPTAMDYASELKWWAVAGGAGVLRPDLRDDALPRYRRFLEGSGEELHYDYGDFLDEDWVGKEFEHDLTGQTKREAREALRTGEGTDLGDQCGPASMKRIGKFALEYTEDSGKGTENWQKAIGGHSVETVVDGQVVLTPDGEVFRGTTSFYSQDMYNFNPKAADYRTGTPDAANGRFEQTGQGKEFLQHGYTRREVDIPLSKGLLPPKKL